MNILYICDEYPPGRHGGIGSVVRSMAQELSKQGHTVVVAGLYDWGYGGEDKFQDGNVTVYRFRRVLDSTLFSRKERLYVRGLYKVFTRTGIFQWAIDKSLNRYKSSLERVIQEHEIDIIETPEFQDYIQYCTRYTPFPQLSKPMIVKLHGSHTYIHMEVGEQPKEFIRQTEEYLLKKSDLVTSVSRYTAERTARYLNYDKEIKVLHNGIETDKCAVNTSKEPGKVIYTGALWEKKGIYQLAKAWNRVVRQIPEARLTIFGRGREDQVKQHLEERAGDTVTFNGYVKRENLYLELASSMVAVFPSYAECFALAPMEAMACGTAVIFTKRASGPELIDNNKTGLLVDPDDVEELAEKIIELLNNPEKTSTLAIAGKELVRREFDISIIAKKNLEVYKEVAGR